MVNLKKVLLAATAGFALASTVLAGDEEVNCRTEFVGTQKIYQGWATCSKTLTLKNDQEVKVTIKDYVSATTSSKATLDKLYYANDGKTYYVTCTADVPYSHEEDVYEEVCDYTPNVDLHVFQDNIYSTTVYADWSDRDGNVNKVEWWVDGVKTSVGSSFNMTRRGSNEDYSKRLQIKVTDNDGYTDADSVTATFKSPNSCPDNRRC